MSSSVMFLFITSRSLCVPASGANVKLLRRDESVYSAKKLSSLDDGSDSLTPLVSQIGFKPFKSSKMCE